MKMTPCIMASKNSDFLIGAHIIEHSPVLIVPVNNNKHKKDTVNTQFTEFSSHAKKLGKQITHNVPLASL